MKSRPEWLQLGDDQNPPGWRQLGNELALLQNGSNMDLYYEKLAFVRAMIEADMECLRPTPKGEPETAVDVKVADLTHRGPGL